MADGKTEKEDAAAPSSEQSQTVQGGAAQTDTNPPGTDTTGTTKNSSQNNAKKAGPGSKINVVGMLKNLGASFKKMRRRTKILVLAAVVAALVVGIIVSVLLNRVHYATLYSGLDETSAGEILKVLEDDKVDAKMKGTDTILVPEDQVNKLKVELAAEGYPKNGLNYDLFTDSSKFGSTDLETRTRLQYTLQENIRSTIRDMDKIKDCIVIVNLAENSSYVVSQNKTPASASVMLELKDGQSIDDSEALSIAKFVMKSVPNLKLKNISIVDSKMHSYDLTGDSASSEKYSATQMQMAEKMKTILTNQALKVLEPAVGSDNVSVSVNLALNFDKKTQKKVQFSAPIDGETEGMLRSKEETENYSGADGNKNSSTGTDSNGVSGTEYVTGSDSKGTSGSTTKTYNYELNEIQTQIEKAQGGVKDLSVSVLLNSKAKGTSETSSKVKSLVANAIGVDKKYISVATLPFVESASGNTFADYLKESQAEAKRATIVEIVKVGLICLTILVAVILILRFLKKRKETNEEELLMGEEKDMGETPQENPGKSTDEELMDDLVKNKSNETEKVEKLVEEYPDTAVQILRNWLSDN